MSLNQYLRYAAVLLAVAICFSSTAFAQDLRELARMNAKHGRTEPISQPSPPWHYPAKSIEQLAQEADLVVRARLSKVRSRLASGNDRVLSDFQFVQPEVISGSVQTPAPAVPGPATPFVLTVFGGEVLVEGIVVRSTDINRAPIQEGVPYLLFLKPSVEKKPGYYEIYSGGIFEVSEDRVTPLLKDAKRVFEGVQGLTLHEIVMRTQKATRR